MRQIYTILAGTLLIFSSCSSTQRVSQTPDDIYYSPGGTKVASSGSSSDDQPEYYSTRPSDQYVQMKSQDYDKWSYFDDYNSYSPYYAPSGLSMGMGMGYYPSYGYGLGFGGASFGLGFGDPYMCWNSYYMWNSWYNPYFYNPYYGGGVIVVNPKGSIGGGGTVYNHPRTFIPNSYRTVSTTGTSGSDRFYRPGNNVSSTQYNRNVRNGNGNGNTYRPAGNNNTYRPSYNNNNQPARSYSPAPSFGGGTRSAGGGGGGGGFSRPGRN